MASSTANDLTRERMQEILDANGELLLSGIQIDNKLLALLITEKAITSNQAIDIRAVVKPGDKRQELLHIISTNLENFLSFCIILHRKLRREDIVRDDFKLKIRDLERQKNRIEERRKEEEEENTRLDELKKPKPEKNGEELEKPKQAPQKDEPSNIDTDNRTPVYKKLEYQDIKQLIIDNRRDFYERFDPTIEVLAELRKVKVITEATENKLKAEKMTPNNKKDEILDTVKMRGIRHFLDFCLVLCHDDIQQDDLVTEVLGLKITDIRTQRKEYPES